MFTGRRANTAIVFLVIIGFIFSLHQYHHHLRQSSLSISSSSRSVDGSIAPTISADYRIIARTERLRATCDQPDPFAQEYGRANLRMSRAYEGTFRTKVR